MTSVWVPVSHYSNRPWDFGYEMKDKVKVQQYGENGWFFARIDGERGVLAFGPTLVETIRSLQTSWELVRKAEERNVT